MQEKHSTTTPEDPGILKPLVSVIYNPAARVGLIARHICANEHLLLCIFSAVVMTSQEPDLSHRRVHIDDGPAQIGISVCLDSEVM